MIGRDTFSLLLENKQVLQSKFSQRLKEKEFIYGYLKLWTKIEDKLFALYLWSWVYDP